MFSFRSDCPQLGANAVQPTMLTAVAKMKMAVAAISATISQGSRFRFRMSPV